MQPEAILPRGYGRGVRAGAGRAAARLRRAGWPAIRHARARPSTSFLASWRQASTRKAPEPIAGSRILRSRIRAHQLVVGPLRHSLRAFAGVQGRQGVEVDDHGGAGSLPGAHRDGAARRHRHLREIEGRAAGGLPAGDVDQPGAVVGAGQAGGSAKFQRVSVLSIPNNKITDVAYVYWIERYFCPELDQRYEIILSKNFIHQHPHPMDVLIPNLHEDRSALRQQIPCHRQPIPQVRQVRMDPVPPRVPERLDLLRLAGDVVGLAVLHVPAGGGPLEVGVELDAVGRIDVDALHLAAQPLPLRQRRHHLQAVAEDHPVRPVGVVAVELGAGVAVRQAVEVGEEIGLVLARLLASPAPPHQIVDQRLGVDLLLDEQRRRLDDEVRPVFHVLAPPDELRVEVPVAAPPGDLDRILVLLRHHRLVLRGRDVLPRRLPVGQRPDLPGLLRFSRHGSARRLALAMRIQGPSGRRTSSAPFLRGPSGEFSPWFHG